MAAAGGGGKPVRKPTKRGPTKAAALKALGLTQEDLDYIKDRNSPSETTVEGEAILRPSNRSDYEPERDHPVLTKRYDDQDEDSEPVWYMRNLRGVDVGFRLSRQTKQGEKRTNLKPRGSRGDLQKLEPGDLKDAELQTQVSYGLVEVIPEGEALEVLRKQYTNVGNQVPPHIAMLRNPKGEEYAQANPVQVATDEEAYGVKVADLDPNLMQGKLSDKEIKRDGGFVQNAQRTPTGGNPAIISDGFMAEPQQDVGASADNAKAAEVDALARSKEFEGPGAGLGKVNVVVEPVRRS